MPILPSPQDIQRSTPNPSTRVATYQGGIVESAKGSTAELTSRMGGELIQMADQRRAQLDELRVIEAASDLRKQELALTFSESNGYQSVKGGDVIKQDFLGTYTEKYKFLVDRVSDSLSPAQRERFAAHTAGSTANFQAGVMRHAMAETEKYGGEVYAADLQSYYDVAGMSYKNGMLTSKQLEGIDASTHHRMNMLGVNDPALMDEYVKAARGGLHTTVIDKAINAGDTDFANTYFKTNSKDMTAKQRGDIERQLKPATDFAAGKLLANDAFQKEVQDPSFNAAEWIANQTDNPQVASAAHSLYVQFVQEKKTAETEQAGTIYKQFYTDPSRETMNAIVNTPEFRNLNDAQQADALRIMSTTVRQSEDREVSLADRAENRIYREETRAYQQEVRADAAERRAQYKLEHSPEVMSAVLKLANSPELAKTSDEYLWGKVGEWGTSNVEYLIGARNKSNAVLDKYKVPLTVLRDVKTASMLKNKEQSNAVDQMVTLETKKYMQKTGQVPDYDTQVAIAREVADRTIEKPGLLWGTNTKELYKLPAKERGFYNDIQSQAERMGRPPLTDEQLTKAWEMQKKNEGSSLPRVPAPPPPAAPTPAAPTPAAPTPAAPTPAAPTPAAPTTPAPTVSPPKAKASPAKAELAKIQEQTATIAANTEKVKTDTAATLASTKSAAQRKVAQKKHDDFMASTQQKTKELEAEAKVVEARVAIEDAKTQDKLEEATRSLESAVAKSYTLKNQKVKEKAPYVDNAKVSAYPGLEGSVEVAPLPTSKKEREAEKRVAEVIVKAEKSPEEGTILNDKKGAIIPSKATKPLRKGTLPLPVEGAKYTSTYSPAYKEKDAKGFVPVGAKGGLKLNVPENTAVKAVADGEVIFAGYLRGYNNLVIVKHGDYQTLYDNNNGLRRQVGDKVRQGDIIGTAGQGGVNFSVRRKGLTVSPFEWLKKRGR